MRWPHFMLIQILLVAIVAIVVYVHKDRIAVTRVPPASLAQWYKPQNKRQVWLHNMFKLRREMQAARLYSASMDEMHLKKWTTLLAEDYLKIGEMVPEWKKKLDMKAITELQILTSKRSYRSVDQTLDAINRSCDSCHEDYKTITATIYRAPDFSSMGEVSPSISFKAHMNELTEQVNRIKIASEDGMEDAALSTLTNLENGIELLGQACPDCHKKDEQVYPGSAITETVARLGDALRTGTLKDQGKELGTLAVLACARCHGTHRLSYDVRKLLGEKPDWLELIKH